MPRSKTIFRWLGIFAVFFVVQTATFYLISPKQLEARLLPDYFEFNHRSDSAYVIDFYAHAEDPPIFTPLSHDLKRNPEKIKEGLKVKFVYFEAPGELDQPNEKDFNLVYYTWVQRSDWLTLSDLFKMKQVEQVIVDQVHVYQREVIYQWCLFFWVKSFEFISSDACSS